MTERRTSKPEFPAPRLESDQESARWPERILELSAEWKASPAGEARDRILGDLWTLVSIGLLKYVRASSRPFGNLDGEEMRDIAADKALDLLGRLDQESWDPSALPPAQLRGFLASVARNGVVDRWRTKGREVPLSAEPTPLAGHGEDAGSPAEPAEHAKAIAECSRGFAPRARFVWFLRVFHELSSVDIARHPDVASTPAGVDSMLLRCRNHMRECMMAKGLDPGRIPSGTFTRLWEIVAPERGSLQDPRLQEPEP